jgi:hypothetical protein
VIGIFITITLIAAFTVDRGIISRYDNGYDHNPRTWYKLTRGWWKGAFSPETTALSIANMISSDRNCELWESLDNGKLSSKALGVLVRFNNNSKASITITTKDGDLHPIVSVHDDYLLYEVYKEFVSRKKYIDNSKIERESLDTINEKTSKNYIDIIEMAERRILNQDSNTNELRVLLEPPFSDKKHVDI